MAVVLILFKLYDDTVDYDDDDDDFPNISQNE